MVRYLWMSLIVAGCSVDGVKMESGTFDCVMDGGFGSAIVPDLTIDTIISCRQCREGTACFEVDGQMSEVEDPESIKDRYGVDVAAGDFYYSAQCWDGYDPFLQCQWVQ